LEIELKSGEETWWCENKKRSTVLKTIGAENNCTIMIQRTLYNHDAWTENVLQCQILSIETKR